MSKVLEQHVVDTSSAEFREGLEAGLNSTADTINWQAGNELGQELKDERQKKSRCVKAWLRKHRLRFS